MIYWKSSIQTIEQFPIWNVLKWLPVAIINQSQAMLWFRQSCPSWMCLLVLHETFAYEDSSKTCAKIFDSFAILSSRNDLLGKARLLTIHPLQWIYHERCVGLWELLTNMGKLIFPKSFPLDIVLLKIEPSFISAVFVHLMRNHRRNLQSAWPTVNLNYFEINNYV